MAGPTPTRPSDPRRPFRRRRPTVVAAALAAGALAVVGCGSDDEAAEATPAPTRATAPAPNSSESVAASASDAAGDASESPATPSQTQTAAQPTATQAPPVSPTAIPTPSGSYATVWPAPAGTIPGRCGGNGIDARMYLNGWELCWTEGTISEPFAVNVAQTLAVNNFASGVYEVPSPVGTRTIECTNFLSPATQTTIINCGRGTITGNGAIELAWLG